MWVGEGGVKEDDPDSFAGYLSSVVGEGRSNNHFHNPLRGPLLTNCGLDATSYLPGDPPIEVTYTGQSSIAWAQYRDQDPGGKWSWYDAREYFYKGLTVPDKTQRDGAMANCFRALGQLMHLVQDAWVPAHTRNQIHIGFQYEKWLEAVRTSAKESGTFDNFMATPVSFDASILSSAPLDSSISIPIANIVDTGKYARDRNPDITASTDVGIAEYSNANFFSERTVFSNIFPYPSRSSVEPTPYLMMDPRGSGVSVTRDYFVKIRDGERNYRAATVGYLRYYITKYFPDYLLILNPREALDGGVYSDYALLLLPRAVGYSAGLLKYFFRGELEPIPTASGVKIKNASSEYMNGTFWILYDSKDGPRKSVASCSIPLATGATSALIGFSEPTDMAKPDEYLLVFRGQMGREDDAVVGRVFSGKKYHWSIVTRCPPYNSRYQTTTEDMASNVCDVEATEVLVTTVDRCPGAEYIDTYLLGSEQVLPDINPNDRSNCRGTLTSTYIGQFTKAEVLSNINYSVHTADHFYDTFTDGSGYLICPVGGEMAYIIGDYEIYTQTPFTPVHWAELPVGYSEVTKIKDSLFPQYDLSCAFRAGDFDGGGLGLFYNYIGRFHYGVTVTMDDVAWEESLGVTFTKVGTIFELGSKRNSVEFRISDSNYSFLPCW